MTQPSYLDRLARHFKAHPLQWIDGRDLGNIAGTYAWRTRLSELRTKRGMDIQNRQRWMSDRVMQDYKLHAVRWKVSEYQYRPAVASALQSDEAQIEKCGEIAQGLRKASPEAVSALMKGRLF